MLPNSIHTVTHQKVFQKAIHGVVYKLMSLYQASEDAYIHFHPL